MLFGENGSGKTTLIKGLLDLIKFSAGYAEKKPVKFTFLPERIHLPEGVGVTKFLENITAIKRIPNASGKIKRYLRDWNLDGEKSISELSKGMRQKMLIIQMLLDDADVYVLDEPLSGLDFKSREYFINLITSLGKTGKTILISTHYPDYYEYDKILHFINGEIHESFNEMSF